MLQFPTGSPLGDSGGLPALVSQEHGGGGLATPKITIVTSNSSRIWWRMSQSIAYSECKQRLNLYIIFYKSLSQTEDI